MAHHNSTPQSVLDAPILFSDPVWITTRIDSMGKHARLVKVRPAFVGDVERDLLKGNIGTSRKGRKVRRAGVR